jgi:hypothetical protein
MSGIMIEKAMNPTPPPIMIGAGMHDGVPGGVPGGMPGIPGIMDVGGAAPPPGGAPVPAGSGVIVGSTPGGHAYT